MLLATYVHTTCRRLVQDGRFKTIMWTMFNRLLTRTRLLCLNWRSSFVHQYERFEAAPDLSHTRRIANQVMYLWHRASHALPMAQEHR